MAQRIMGDVPAFLEEKRSEGVSYARISSMLQDHDVIVGYETIRIWCQQLGIDGPNEVSPTPGAAGSASRAPVLGNQP
jgi:hypothetical protein